MKKDVLTISGRDLLLNGSDKLGRHNTTQNSHVHKTARDKVKDRNSKSSKKTIHSIKKDYL